ncbi:hypothetical protein GCM10027089_29890 [Nocardia thraciensis]
MRGGGALLTELSRIASRLRQAGGDTPVYAAMAYYDPDWPPGSPAFPAGLSRPPRCRSWTPSTPWGELPTTPTV